MKGFVVSMSTASSRVALPTCLLLLALSGCESGGGGSGGSPVSADEQLVVDAVRFVDTVEASVQTATSDCGYSARIGGRTVWLFGDTILKVPNEDDKHLLCNSWSYTFDMDAGDGLAGFSDAVDAVGAPSALIPLNEDELAYNERHSAENCMEEPCGARWALWPGAILPHPDETHAYVFYHKFLVEPGVLNFSHVGHSIALWENFSAPAERPEFNLFEGYPSLFFSSTGTLLGDGFGSAAVHADGYFYIYGCEYTATSGTSPCHLARVPVAGMLERDAWRFLDAAGGWSPELEQAAKVFNGSNMMTVFYNGFLGRYVAIYSKPVSLDVMLRTAPSPWGPWSVEMKLFSAQPSAGEIDWVYDALAHPEFSPDNGQTIHITYTRQLAPLRTEMRLVEVRLRIDRRSID